MNFEVLDMLLLVIAIIIVFSLKYFLISAYEGGNDVCNGYISLEKNYRSTIGGVDTSNLGIRKKYPKGLQVTFHGSGCIFEVAGRDGSLKGTFGIITVPKKLNIMPILKNHFIKIDIDGNKRKMIYTVYIEELYLDDVKFIDLLKCFDLSLIEYLSQK